MDSMPLSMRFSNETIEKMDYLCGVTGMTRPALISSYIALEYDRLHGNPELNKTFAQMKELEAQLKAFIAQK